MPQAALAVTEDRRRCTGEPHQALRALLPDTDQPLTIPAARHPEQAQLEAAVFLACCEIGSLSEHPLGIIQVCPEEDRTAGRIAFVRSRLCVRLGPGLSKSGELLGLFDA
ncbi:hypothetical protein ACFYXM_24135 [Streptomyces sp. NPDC002476]|uniref:hypothetical protein n=1 Tax=Streptomyces sp. NPDC002476 TaxID=3364648 RepID=UPI0036938FEB